MSTTSEENKTFELKDEDLEKVTGGGVSTNSNGEYVVNKGDLYKRIGGDRSSYPCNYYALESKTTKDPQDTVYVCRRQAGGVTIDMSDTYVTISFLNTLSFVENCNFDPHLL